ESLSRRWPHLAHRGPRLAPRALYLAPSDLLPPHLGPRTSAFRTSPRITPAFPYGPRLSSCFLATGMVDFTEFTRHVSACRLLAGRSVSAGSGSALTDHRACMKPDHGSHV